MSDQDPPREPPSTDAHKGRFKPGNKIGRGRPKGAENKFGPGFRDRLLAGIARSGQKKAKKAGINHKIDGLEYFVENLVDTNGGAAATLIAKLIPPEAPPPEASGITPGVVVNIVPVLSGNMFAPGKSVLLPYDECEKSWTAYKAGAEAWQAYLKAVEPQLTLAAFAKLSQVVPPEPKPELELEPVPEPIIALEAPVRLRAIEDTASAGRDTESDGGVVMRPSAFAPRLPRKPNGDL